MNGSIPGFNWSTGVGYFKVSCEQCGWELHEDAHIPYSEMKLRALRHSRQHDLTHPASVQLTAEAAVEEIVVVQEPPYSLDYRYTGVTSGEWKAECRHCGSQSTFITNRYAPLTDLIMSGRWGWITEHYSLHRGVDDGDDPV